MWLLTEYSLGKGLNSRLRSLDLILRALGSHRSFGSRGSRGVLEHLKDFLGHPVDRGNLEEENEPICFR